MVYQRKLIEGGIGPVRRARLVRDVVEEAGNGEYTYVHVLGMDYGGMRDFREYMRFLEDRMKQRPLGKLQLSHSLVGMSPSPDGPYREVAEPETTFMNVPPWGLAIPTGAEKLLYIAWEDQTGKTGYSARSGPIALAYLIGQERVPRGNIALAAELDGGGIRKEGFVHFAALRLYYPKDYTGFVRHLEREATRDPSMRNVVNDLDKRGLMDLFAERSTPPPEWSFDERYRHDRRHPTSFLRFFLLPTKIKRDAVINDVEKALGKRL